MLSPSQADEVARLLTDNARLMQRRLDVQSKRLDLLHADNVKLKNRTKWAKYRVFCLGLAIVCVAIHSAINSDGTSHDWLRGVAIGAAGMTALLVWAD